jgi:mannose/fructose-specific phosphotransferase system component IIA
MYIEKYTAHIKDANTRKSFKIILDENTPQDAHKKIFNRLNNYQDIVKITDNFGGTVYNQDAGFINN